VRIAKNQNLTTIVADLFQPFEIHFIIAVFTPFQRIEHHFAPVALRCQAERMIHGRLNNDLVTWCGKGVNDEPDTFDNAGNVAQPFTLYGPLVMALEPIDNRRSIIFGFDSITEDGVFESLSQCFNNERGRSEVHISHPKWQ